MLQFVKQRKLSKLLFQKKNESYLFKIDIRTISIIKKFNATIETRFKFLYIGFKLSIT